MPHACRRLSRRYYQPIIEVMRDMPVISTEDTQDPAVIKNWFGELTNLLNTTISSNTEYTFEVFSTEDDVAGAKITFFNHGIEVNNNFMPEFFSSEDYKKLSALEAAITLDDSAYIQRHDRKQALTNTKQAFDWLLKEAEQGLSIQRYKGLGEMNPEQLFETTMDVSQRSLSQVKIGDAIEADLRFVALMGDDVAPRRDFIEKHAQEVENIDI